MARSAILESLILKSVDIGEADRFCIIFTREAGRMAVRAKAVRKPGSRMGGLLLPFRRVRLEINDSGKSSIVTGAADLDMLLSSILDHVVVGRMGQGIEMLLLLTEDGEPLPEVFDLTKNFLRACVELPGSPVLIYKLALLGRLGLLPQTDDDPRFAMLSDEAKSFILCLRRENNISALAACEYPKTEVAEFLEKLLMEQLPRALRA